ncbi:T9SS type B sorting domain-containing protein [Flavobacterium litorale]|uniref:T9SS type B sorting domain-containing protein n=1 Tax=Flavobacterium litorale TaxID=2856519 RepID=A0ABX8V6S3_9FLAO|nr:T9SS type B sorting domain-containing protein [Flavobacterium litorale]QYJ68535.1 T9SS type B sorting domain-containing protein [Flavobacterium litorale]
MNKCLLILAVIFFIPLLSFAQLADFNLEVIVTDESCDDNGTLTFNVTNTTEGANFLFTVFLEPDLDNPIAVTEALSVANLDSGDYTIIATQSLNGESNSQEVSVTINNIIEPLSYQINAVNQNCTVGGRIEIVTISGTAAEYEIISGPETRPLQESNIFSELDGGTYNIRVFDICGQGVVTTYTLVIETANPVVSAPEFEDVITTDCDSAIVVNTITYPNGFAISYPLTVVYTIYPPNGDPEIIQTITYEEGAPNSLELVREFDLYDGEPYTYDISITNSCGNEFGNAGVVVNLLPTLSDNVEDVECGNKILTLSASQFSPPYFLEFTAVPDGFNPDVFNTIHPGPFNTSSAVYGSEENSMPEGSYTVVLTDNCGRTASAEFDIVNEIPTPVFSARNNGCFSDSGRISVSVGDRQIAIAEILQAPDAYVNTLSVPLPQDVSSSINSSGRLLLLNMPLGTYLIRITDDCGDIYEDFVTVPPFTEQEFTITPSSDCTIGVGAIAITSGNANLNDIVLVTAPAGYEGTLPENLSASIDNVSGDFFLDNLPEGNYIFVATDVCGIQAQVTTTVVGYQPSENPFTFVPNCGSFDIIMTDNAVSSSTPSYWLQRLINAETNEWGHPDTGAVYPDGTVPDEGNSITLQNNTTIFNLTFTGDFRILKSFETFGNGTEQKNCFEELGFFNYFNQPRINGVYNISCSDNPDDIVIDADGIPPLNYRIEDPDTNAVILDNGTDNTFSGLAAGTYRFVVEDDCGNVSRLNQNINVLPDLVVATQPDNLFHCIDMGDEPTLSHEFDLSVLNSTILGDQSEALYELTYHASLNDANAGENPLPDLYTATGNTTTIYAKLIQRFIPICDDIISFELVINQNPVLDVQEQYYLCDDGTVTLSAGNGYDSYLWSTEETSPSITVNETGTYTVTVADGECETTTEILVNLSSVATIIDTTTVDWTYNNNAIMVTVSGAGDYEFSINGILYQAENTFTGLETGVYTLYIRDRNGCGVIEEEVVLLNYPKFFTPNGDGVNETWRIPFSSYEPDLFVYIYDRYGKLITGFDALNQGWDGTYNGNKLPSTDYWFVVTRQDGRTHKGHFAMVR